MLAAMPSLSPPAVAAGTPPEPKAAPTKSAAAEPPNVTSPEVVDGKVTFRLWAPQAKEVAVFGDYGWEPRKLGKDSNGVWSVTVPMSPGIWGYTFSVDGQKLADPVNGWLKPSRYPNTSGVLVPAMPPAPFERQGAPAGTVHLHTYDASAAGERRLRVYTPPGYESGRERHPVLYLLHGFSDNEAAWTEFGRAHVIADNLLAAKKMVPMVIVMTDGHAIPIDRQKWRENLHAYQKDLLDEVVPFVESRYRVKKTPADRAIVGLSMGGEQALSLGLNNPHVFSYVGAMSAATRNLDEFEPGVSKPQDLNKKLRWLWVAVGKDDFLLEHNRKFIEVLKGKGIEHQYKETEGAHTWGVWRGYLTEVLPALFKAGRPRAASAK